MNGQCATWQLRFTKTRDLLDHLKGNPIEPNNKPRLMASLEELAASLNEVLNFIHDQQNQQSAP